MADRAELLRVIEANIGFELSGTGVDYSSIVSKLATAETSILQRLYDTKAWSSIAFQLIRESK